MNRQQGESEKKPDGQTPSSRPEYPPFYDVVKLKHDAQDRYPVLPSTTRPYQPLREHS